MSRRRAAVRREISPDSIYLDRVVAKFINCMMYDGKKSTSESVFYGALADIKVREMESINVFRTAVDNAKPAVEVKSRRVGGATYPVPIPVAPFRAEALAIRWLIGAARKRGEKTMRQRLAAELSDAFQAKGSAVKKREDTHRMAEANKAFSHYRW